MRMSIQNEVPDISRTVEIPGSDERVGINSLRKGNKKNPDLNRVYANNLDVDVNRQLFLGCAATFDSFYSPQLQLFCAGSTGLVVGHLPRRPA